MPINLRFECVIETDWHIGAGFGAGSQIDSVIERDSAGNPVINGSSLKGLFRDALFELHQIMSADASPYSVSIDDPPADLLLGIPGHESRWLFDAARPETLVESTVVTGVRVDPALRRAEEFKFFTKEMGQAARFVFQVTSPDAGPNALEEVEWLVAGASFIKRLGNRRRRGAGRCRFRLISPDLHDALLQNFGARHTGMEDVDERLISQLIQESRQYQATDLDQQPAKRYRLILRAERPVIVSGQAEAGNVYRSQSFIPGFTVRGAFASRVTQDEQIDADSDFARLFLLGNAAFSHLMPINMEKGKASLTAPTPMGLQRSEDGDGFHPGLVAGWIKQKPYKNKLHCLQDGYPKADTAKLETHMHVAIDPNTKRADDGNLYAYDTIPAGTFFAGEIDLKGEAWEVLGSLIDAHCGESFTLRVGKGRNRGYGLCTAWVEPIDTQVPPTWINSTLEERLDWKRKDANRRLIMTVVTDTILTDAFGRFLQQFDNFTLRKLLDTDSFTIGEQIARVQQLDNFDTYSGLPRWRDLALAAGSSVVLQGIDVSVLKDKLERIEREGIGLRRAEGYGRVVFNHPAFTGLHKFEPFTLPDALKPAPAEMSHREIVQKWRQTIDDYIKQNQHFFDKSMRELNTALARRLVQEMPLDLNEAELLLRNIGQPAAGSDKSPRFEVAHLELVYALMQYLTKDVPLPWRRGLVILAESIARGIPEASTT